jgi:UDP-N-acetylmuramate dehydrogenase
MVRDGGSREGVNAAWRRDLAARVPCEIRFDEPLARHTTYRIGGPATALVLPRQPDDAVAAVRFATESGTPWLALGLGSNMLVSDRGFPGMVLRIGKGLDRLARSGPEGSRWTAGAGLPTPLLARQSAKAGQGGMERLIGVPGTVGGGVFMHAGAHGQDYAAVTRTVSVVDPGGTVRTIAGGDMAWRYRSSGLVNLLVIEATLELEPRDPAATMEELNRYLQKRKEGTPFDQPCCGSVFRNPAGPMVAGGPRTAGQLIDSAGLKGLQIGGARVSPMHANYIVNLGGATASDVLALVETIRRRVQERFGVELALEVKLVGF